VRAEGTREREGERRTEAEELGTGGEEQPLFLSTPSFLVSPEEEDDLGVPFLCKL